MGEEHQQQCHWVAGYPSCYPRDWTPLGTNWQTPNAAGLWVPAADLDSIPLRTVPASLSSESTGSRICLSVNELVLFQALQNSAAVCGWCWLMGCKVEGKQQQEGNPADFIWKQLASDELENQLWSLQLRCNMNYSLRLKRFWTIKKFAQHIY